ncbi:hypothetical protein ACMFMG_002828 [Clarireedia jacksonii]
MLTYLFLDINSIHTLSFSPRNLKKLEVKKSSPRNLKMPKLNQSAPRNLSISLPTQGSPCVRIPTPSAHTLTAVPLLTPEHEHEHIIVTPPIPSPSAGCDFDFQDSQFDLDSNRGTTPSPTAEPLPTPASITPVISRAHSTIDSDQPFTLSSRRLLSAHCLHVRTPPPVSPSSPQRESPSVSPTTGVSPTSSHLLTPPFHTPPLSRTEAQGYFSPVKSRPRRSSKLSSYQPPKESSSQSRARAQAQAQPQTSAFCLSPPSHSSKEDGSSSHFSSSAYTCSSESLSSWKPPVLYPVPPYSPRRQSSESLTMIKPPHKRRKTIGIRQERKKKRKCQGTCDQGRRKKPLITMEECKRTAYWWLPPSPVAPTGSKLPKRAQKNLSQKSKDLHKKVLMSGAAPALVTRRWSSVEIGTKQLKLPPIMSKELMRESKRKKISPVFRNSIFSSNPIEERNRSSSFTTGAKYNDLMRVLHERLTVRKVSPTQTGLPAAITLRRPSIATEHVSTAALPKSDSGAVSPFSERLSSTATQRPESETYIITKADIDSIAEYLRQTFPEIREGDNKCTGLGATRGSSGGSLSPMSRSHSSLSFTNRGIVPLASPALGQVQKYDVESDKARKSAVEEWDVGMMGSRQSIAKCAVHPETSVQPYRPILSSKKSCRASAPQATSSRSLHEVIWEEQDSPHRQSCTSDEGHNHLHESISPNQSPGTSLGAIEENFKTILQSFQQSNQNCSCPTDKASFDPTNARASITRWSWQCEPEEIGGFSLKVHPQPRNPPQPSSPQKASVFSFPPLPRKSTSEWNKPLPATEGEPSSNLSITAPHPAPLRKSLYDMGIDARTSPDEPDNPPSSSSSTRKHSIAMNLEHDNSWLNAINRPKSDNYLHHKSKSIVKPHPMAPARSGRPSQMGCSLGSCTGARRGGSVGGRIGGWGGLGKKIVAIDHPEEKGKSTGTGGGWTKLRQDSGYPLVARSQGQERGQGTERWGLMLGSGSASASAKNSRQAEKIPGRSQSQSQSPGSPREQLHERRRSLAWESLNLVLGSCSPSPSHSPKTQSQSGMEKRRSVAWDSLAALRDRFPATDPAEMNLGAEEHQPFLQPKNMSPRSSMIQNSLSLLQSRFPSTSASISKVNYSGIGMYEKAMAGRRMSEGQQYLMDCQPEVGGFNCDACASVSSPSVDWIG